KSARRPIARSLAPTVSEATIPCPPTPVTTSYPHGPTTSAMYAAVRASCIESSGWRCRCSNHSRISPWLAASAAMIGFIDRLPVVHGAASSRCVLPYRDHRHGGGDRPHRHQQVDRQGGDRRSASGGEPLE